MRAPNVLTIPPGVAVLDTFVAAFLAGNVVAGEPAADDPLALADATIYVPTRRAARALAESFRARAASGAVVLPRILPLGALEATETELILAEPEPAPPGRPLPGLPLPGLPLPPAASSIWRRTRLAALVQAWSRAVAGALRSVGPDGELVTDPGEAFRVATSSVDAFALAGDLARLIDELAIEGVEWRALDALRMAGFDDYWRITTTFLDIAVGQWRATLAEAGLVDPAERRLALVAAQAAALQTGTCSGPVVAIGSTGTNKATARLLAAIACSPRGAVVLPGLDLELDEAAWALVAGGRRGDQEPSFGHPQAAMARLLPIIGIARADVRTIGTPAPAAAARTRLVAEALRPADTTEQWRGFRRKTPQKAIAAALDGVGLVEAVDEREEALCLAIAMREAVETPGRTAALVTPDRELARRVRGELLRWNIEVLDTAGEPLAARPLGVLARLAMAAAFGGPRDLAALLAHPLASFGQPREEVARRAAQLDIGVLRTTRPGGRERAAIFAEARSAASDRHAHPAQKGLGAVDWAAIEALWSRVDEALAPLRAIEGPQTLDRWVAAHRAAIADTVDSWAPDEAGVLEALFDELTRSGDAPIAFDAEGYAVLFRRLSTEIALPNAARPHPRLAIYGLLEARLVEADVILLAGLDEGIWPPQATSDPFLNRPMRAELGLLPPERRIGQTAHDFCQAMGAPQVLLSRARKRAGSPTVASRYLLRLEALAGNAWEACHARGERILQLARALDHPMLAPIPIKRPQPTPPVALRPTQLSVTEIETLRRDPYAVYAAKILKLVPLSIPGDLLDAGELGGLMHNVLHTFTIEAAKGSAAERRERLLRMAHSAFAPALADPQFETLRWPILKKALDLFLEYDAKQRTSTQEVRTETSGRLGLDLADLSHFTLTARADRIDLHRDGRATLIDYKTGTPPGLKEVRVGFAPQLTLEAAMLRHGGFDAPHAGAIEATYLKLGGKDGGKIIPLAFDDEPFDDVVERHFAGLKRLLSSFRAEATAYPSRPFPKFARPQGDYDHLARVREWSLAADDEALA